MIYAITTSLPEYPPQTNSIASSHPLPATLLQLATFQQDTRYLKPFVVEIEAEQAERKQWDSATKA